MGFPHREVVGMLNGRPIDVASRWLKTNYGNNFMIWNLSEETYDYDKFDQQVIEFRFPGYAAAPLNKIFGICNSIHGWLQSDINNIAVVHCKSGNGRTVSTVASYIAWAGVVGSPSAGLSLCAEKRGMPISSLVNPSQRRYVNYVQQLLAGKPPSVKPMRLERIIMNGMPHIEEDGGRIRPYLQIFKR